jgi:hypothetical protein
MSQPTVEAAAMSCAVGRATLFRWLRDETFCAELRRAGDDAIAATARRLADLSGLAVDTLKDVMSAEDATYAEKLRASGITLAQLLSLKELHDLGQRVALLEEVAQKNGNGNVKRQSQAT